MKTSQGDVASSLNIVIYYISQLVRALLLVNLGGRILPYGPLKFEAAFVAKMFLDLSPSVLNCSSK